MVAKVIQRSWRLLQGDPKNRVNAVKGGSSTAMRMSSGWGCGSIWPGAAEAWLRPLRVVGTCRVSTGREARGAAVRLSLTGNLLGLPRRLLGTTRRQEIVCISLLMLKKPSEARCGGPWLRTQFITAAGWVAKVTAGRSGTRGRNDRRGRERWGKRQRGEELFRVPFFSERSLFSCDRLFSLSASLLPFGSLGLNVSSSLRLLAWVLLRIIKSAAAKTCYRRCKWCLKCLLRRSDGGGSPGHAGDRLVLNGDVWEYQSRGIFAVVD